MTYEEIRAAIETHLAAWTDAPIAWDGVPIGPDVQAAQDQRTPWVRVTINDGDSFTSGIGDKPCVRRTGLIICQVFTARDIGSAPARSLASSLAAHIEHWQSGTLSTYSAGLTRIGPDDNYYQVNVSCAFRAD